MDSKIQRMILRGKRKPKMKDKKIIFLTLFFISLLIY